MALQPKKPGKGKPAKAAPITAHPLFPAVVALWFGALLGLGSLAIRVGLIESLVLAARIDTVIPAAAPPLGVSARIMLALSLAALGALLGAALARRLAAPKVVVRERKRKATLSPDESVNLRSRDAHPDAPARRPLSIHDEVGDNAEGSTGDDDAHRSDPLAGRRRSTLAIEHDDTFELHELAPLPGGAPMIQPLDLADYAEPAAAPPFSSDAVEAPNFSPPPDALSGRQVFGMTHPQPDDVLDQLGITDAEFEPLPKAADPGPVMHPEFHAPAAVIEERFAQPADSEPPREAVNAPPSPDLRIAGPGLAGSPGSGAAKPDPDTLPMTALAQRLADSMQRRRSRSAEAAAAVAAPAAMPDAAPVAAVAVDPVVTGLTSGNAPIPVAPPAGLAFSHPNDVPTPRLPEPQASPEPQAEPEQGFGPLACPEPAEHDVAAGLISSVPASSKAEPVAIQAPIVAPIEAPAPVSTPEPTPESTPLPTAMSDPTSVTVLQMPAALRPLDFSSLPDDGEGDDLDGFLPPRSFPGVGRIQPKAVPQSYVSAAPAADFDEAQAGGEEELSDIASEDSAEDQYSSLLDLGRPAEIRQNFVRIDDAPIRVDDAAEPAVIFPGQAAGQTLGMRSPPGGEQSEGAPSFRRFDAPDNADSGQSIAAGAEVPHDPAETERALRMALANLQRMSGAA